MVNVKFIALLVGTLTCFGDEARAGSCSAAKLCCQGRDSGCVIQKESGNAIMDSPRDKPCYCDHACLKLADCCDDFKETCGVVDCTVSEWSAWSACGNGCGSGTQRRSRVIKMPEKNGGKHCPKLDQIRTCRSYEECRSGIHWQQQQRDKGLTILSLYPAAYNDSSAGNEDKLAEASTTCVAFTIVRASRACGRISSSLAEGSRICVERKEHEGFEKLVGIGRWKLSRGVVTGSVARAPAMNSTCHGKWIGDSRLLIDCADPRCKRLHGVPRLTKFFHRSRRSVAKAGRTTLRKKSSSVRRRRRGRRRRKRRRSEETTEEAR